MPTTPSHPTNRQQYSHFIVNGNDITEQLRLHLRTACISFSFHKQQLLQQQQKKENKYVWRGKHFHFIYTTRTHTAVHNARHIEEKVLDFVALWHVFRGVRLYPLFIVTFCLRFYLTNPSLSHSLSSLHLQDICDPISNTRSGIV